MDFKGRNIDAQSSLLAAMRQMDMLDKKLLLVQNGSIFLGLLSIGDIQRAIINDFSLETKIGAILRKNIRYAIEGSSFDQIRKMMLEYRMEMCPILDTNGNLVQLFFWEEIFGNKVIEHEQFNIPVVIMAGGFGTRLRPLTNVLPKPLIPIGEKTMLEEIFERFHRHGCNNFYLSVNYKADLIDFYIKSLQLPYNAQCFLEQKPLGTAGSLHLLKGKINETFFVSNCDILIEDDYANILAYHREHKNEITLVSAIKNLNIPYGTLESGEEGQLVQINEKPELVFKINSGMYILEPHLISQIPENEFYHITQLIEKIIKRGGRVGVFPVSEKSWKDIGNWEEYVKYIENGK